MAKYITLISPPWYSGPKAVGRSHNLGLGYIAAYLERAGHRVKIIDALEKEGIKNLNKVSSGTADLYQVGLSYDQIVERIPKQTDYIGITVPFTSYALILKELARNIRKRYPEITIIAGGVFPSTLPEKAMACADIDYAVCGEGEETLLKIVSGMKPEKIKGVAFRENGKPIIHGTSELIGNLDEIPFPARNLLPMDEYLYFTPRDKTHKRTVSLITSRGCPYDCNFCSVHCIYGYKWRARSPENVLAEIRQLIKEYDIEHIQFEDDNLTLNKERAEKIFEGMLSLSKKVTWSSPNGIRVDTLDYLLLKKMKKSGCNSLCIGVESGHPEILKAMNKNIDLNKVMDIAKVCRELKIYLSVFFIIGYLGETEKHFKETLRYAARLRRSGVRFCHFFPIRTYPGTQLFDYCRKNNLLLDEENNLIFIGDRGNIGTKECPPVLLKERIRLAKLRINPLHTIMIDYRLMKFIRKIIPNQLIRKLKELFGYPTY